MSDLFSQPNIYDPTVNLGVSGGTRSEQTAKVLIGIERLIGDKPAHMIVIYDDTNMTLAGALDVAKDRLPLDHNELGLRLFN